MPLTPLNALQVVPWHAHIPKVPEPSLASQCSLLVSWAKTKALGRSGSISDAQWSLSSAKPRLRGAQQDPVLKYRVWDSSPLSLCPSPGGVGAAASCPRPPPEQQ